MSAVVNFGWETVGVLFMVDVQLTGIYKHQQSWSETLWVVQSQACVTWPIRTEWACQERGLKTNVFI